MERVGEHPVPAGRSRYGGVPTSSRAARRRHARRPRERGLGSMAVARARGCTAGVPLAGSARQRDRVGRHAISLPRRRAARRDGGARVVAHGASSARALPPGVRPRRGIPLLVPGARVRAARRRRRRAAADRRAAPRRPPARLARSRGGGSARGAGGAARHRRCGSRRAPRPRRSPRPRLVTAPARRARRGLRGRRRRDRRRVEGRPTPPGRLGPGRWPQPPVRRAAPAPVAHRRAEPETHEGLPAAPASDGLFEGRAVVRLRSRSGRPSD